MSSIAVEQNFNANALVRVSGGMDVTSLLATVRLLAPVCAPYEKNNLSTVLLLHRAACLHRVPRLPHRAGEPPQRMLQQAGNGREELFVTPPR
jgi:hypothetical protein